MQQTQHPNQTSPGSTRAEQRQCESHGEYVANIQDLRPVMEREIASQCPRCADEQRAAEEAERREYEQRIRADRVRRAFRGALIPPRFEGKSLDGYEASNEGQQRALKISKAYADQFDDRMTTGGGLVFCGAPGTGKTHLAAAIANQVIHRGHTALFRSVLQVSRAVKETYSRNSEKTEQQAINVFLKPDLLILDEVGVQFGTEAEKLILFDILNDRYSYMRPTILISNLTQAELEHYIGARVLDRMREGGGAVIAFDWGSYRSKAQTRIDPRSVDLPNPG